MIREKADYEILDKNETRSKNTTKLAVFEFGWANYASVGEFKIAAV